MNTENKFEWTDELVREFMCELLWNKNIHGEKPKDFSVGVGNSSFLMEEFKKSKQQNTIQKDWEIMSFVVKSSRVVLGKTEEGDFGNNIFRIDENELLKSPNHKINSVKRISDGEVFSLGDDVNFGIIEGFYICEEEDSFCYKCMMVYFKEVRANRDISELKKVNQPLFKTEDGIEVKEQDSVWVVNSAFAKPFIVSVKGIEWYNETNNHFKYFSTEEAAQTWVLMNKPVLSVNDIMKAAPLMGKYYEDGIKGLAKSKIEGK